MRRLVIPLLATALTVAAAVSQTRTVEPRLCEEPRASLKAIPGYTHEIGEASEAELHVLPSDTRIERRTYTAEDGTWFMVSLIVGGRTKSSLHRPELCLPAQGFQMSDPRNRTVDGVDWHLVTLLRRESEPLGFAYTFFNQEGVRTSSHVRRILRDVWDRSFLSRIDRWAMLTVNASTADPRRFERFLSELKGVWE